METTETTETFDSRVQALAKHLGCDPLEVHEADYGDNTFRIGRHTDYLVLTDEEADEATESYIREHLWTFDIDFIATHFKVDLNDAAREAMRELAGRLCEGANPIFEALVEDFDTLASCAIGIDGRGHFLAQYDGNENEVKVDGTTYYIYRQ